MRLKIRKIIRQIKAGEFAPSKQSQYPIMDPGDRRAVHAPMCIR